MASLQPIPGTSILTFTVHPFVDEYGNTKNNAKHFVFITHDLDPNNLVVRPLNAECKDSVLGSKEIIEKKLFAYIEQTTEGIFFTVINSVRNWQLTEQLTLSILSGKDKVEQIDVSRLCIIDVESEQCKKIQGVYEKYVKASEIAYQKMAIAHGLVTPSNNAPNPALAAALVNGKKDNESGGNSNRNRNGGCTLF